MPRNSPKFAKCQHFVNADLIALGLSPFDPVRVRLKAGRLLWHQIEDFVAEKESFGFESTLEGKAYIPFLQRARMKNYRIHVFFLWIPDVRLAKNRIKQRVKNGGHDVPVVDIERRFIRSRVNFIKYYRPLCHSWIIFDNSFTTPKEIAKGNGDWTRIVNEDLYEQFGEDNE